MTHLIAMNCLLAPALALFNVPSLPHVSKSFYIKRLIPLSLSKGLGAITAHFSLWRVPISYAHTSELNPIITCHYYY